jgi:hypothetical protein
MSDFGWLPQRTIKYKTYIKTALVEALRDVFGHHRDSYLSKTHVTIDYPRTEADYPALIVRFFERDIKNAGVGHEEMLTLTDADGVEGRFRFKHSFYTGDLEFSVYALSSLDRDLIGDSLVQTIMMGNLEEYTNRFFGRIYTDSDAYPDSTWHAININTDNVQGFGETQTQVPWASEDDLIYQTSYRVKVFGEFYSLPPDLPLSFVQTVTQYPYIDGPEDVPTGDSQDQTEWLPPVDFS